MIVTGTDIKPLEIVMFLRSVKSRNYFEQMKGRGVRVISPTDLQGVTPDAKQKDRFVLVDCVGIVMDELIDQPPLERNPGATLEQLLNKVALNAATPDDLSSLASRLARLDRALNPKARQELTEAGNGVTISQIAHGLVDALDPDAQVAAARMTFELDSVTEPSAEQLDATRKELLREAAKPLMSNAPLRNAIVIARRRTEQTIDKLPEFVEAYWNSVDGAEAVSRVASSTSGLFTLSVRKIGEIEVPLPPLELQKQTLSELARMTSSFDDRQRAIESSLLRASRLRQAILRQAFNGSLSMDIV